MILSQQTRVKKLAFVKQDLLTSQNIPHSSIQNQYFLLALWLHTRAVYPAPSITRGSAPSEISRSAEFIQSFAFYFYL